MGRVYRILLAAAGLLALAGCTGPSRSGPSAAHLAKLPKLDGHIAYPRLITQAPTPVRSTWAQLQRLLANPLPKPPGKQTAKAHLHFVKTVLQPWLSRRDRALQSMIQTTERSNRHRPEDQLLALLAMAYAYEATVEALSGIEPEAAVRARFTPTAWARWLRDALPRLWKGCAALAAEAPPSLRAWKARCLAKASQYGAGAARPRAPPKLPDVCKGSIEYTDPDAPPPDRSLTAKIAVARFAPYFKDPDIPQPRMQDEDQVRLLRAVGEGLRDRGYALVEPERVEAAQRLVTQRRWRTGGPKCGQAPPLAALLTPNTPHLVLARVRTFCFKSGCYLTVLFDRAGTDDEADLPESVTAKLQGPYDDPAAWVDAARRLDTKKRLSGMVGLPPATVLRVLGHEKSDPWLRTAPTVRAQASALLRCHARGVSALDVTIELNTNGTPTAVRAMPTHVAEGTNGSTLSSCVVEVLKKTAWPCPRDEQPKKVDFRLCLGR